MVKQITGSVKVYGSVFVFVITHVPVLEILGHVYCLIVMA